MQAVEASKQALADHGNTLLVAPTGAGKTIMLSALTGHCIKNAPDNGPNKALIIQHRDELVDQNARKFQAVNPTIPISYYQAGTKMWNGRAVFGMIQTVARAQNLATMPPLHMLTIDETHHATAGSYEAVIEWAKKLNPKVLIFGTTATPNRGDGTPLRKVFSNVADQITIGELIASGHLVRPRTFVIDVGATEALRSVKRLASDFDMAEVAQIMDREVITDKVIEHWRTLAGTRQTVVFCSTVAHAVHVSELFRAHGTTSAVVHGDLSKGDRADVLADYARGRIQVLVNVAVLTEGWDHPPTSCVILLRPSSYKSTMTQMVGRGLRIVDPAEYPGVVKLDCIVLDFGTSSLNHGSLEDDADLDGRKKGDAPMKDCPACGATIPISCLECPLCGFQYEPAEKKAKGALEDFVLTEIDLLTQSNFKWLDIWGDGHALMAAGFDAWAGLFNHNGLWHAVGGDKDTLRHLGVGERITALAIGDDFLNAHEEGNSAFKTKRWLKEPATAKQLNILGLPESNVSLNKYEAMCRLSFQFNKRAIKRLVTNYAPERLAA